MKKHANVDDSDQWPLVVDEPVEAQLLTANAQTATVQIVSISPDSAHLSLPAELSLVSGQDVQILLTPSTRRFAIVQLLEYFGAGYHGGVRWKYAHHRDAVRAAVLLSNNEALSDSAIRFNRKLPDLVYHLWQFMDAGRLRDIADVIVQFKSAAKIAGGDLVEKCQELEDTIEIGGKDEAVAIALDELCRKCALQIVKWEPDMPHSTPVNVSDSLGTDLENREELLGTSAWVVGTVVSFAGYLLIIF